MAEYTRDESPHAGRLSKVGSGSPNAVLGREVCPHRGLLLGGGKQATSRDRKAFVGLQLVWVRHAVDTHCMAIWTKTGVNVIRAPKPLPGNH
jgi:hypothetical protein